MVFKIGSYFLFGCLYILVLLWTGEHWSLASPSPARTNPYESTTTNSHSSSTNSIITTNQVRSSDSSVSNKGLNSNNVNSNSNSHTRSSSSNNNNNNGPLDRNRAIGRNESGGLTNGTQGSCSEESMATGKCSRPIGFDMKKLSLELIRHDILRKLRLDENRLPNVTAIPKEYLTTLTGIVEMQNDSPIVQYDDDHATTEKIIAFSRTQQVKVNGKGLSAHYFTFTDKLTNMGIDTATLHILVKFHDTASPLLRKGEFYIRVMQLVSEIRGESPVFNNYGPVKAIIHPPQPGQPHFRHDGTKWIQIDVRHVFSKWLANTPLTTSRKMGLLFACTDAAQNPIAEVTVVSGSDVSVNQNPFLEVEVSERGRSRTARDLGLDCVESLKETRCCRYPLTVDFDEFGWDWVIAPKQYEANYCSGECPYAFLQKYPHNHIVQQVNRGVGGPCCTARKLSPITMLHFDQAGNIVFSVLPGMLVDQCGCS